MPYVVIQDRLDDTTGIWVLLTTDAWWPLDALRAGRVPVLGGVRYCTTWEEAADYSRKNGGPCRGNRILTARAVGIPKPSPPTV